jgi:hypothetical protein
MSVYALQGLLPPLSSLTSTSRRDFSSSHTSNHQEAKSPQHHNLNSKDKVISKELVANEESVQQNCTTEIQRNHEYSNTPREVGILVKDAKIDLSSLVKSFTNRRIKCRQQNSCSLEPLEVEPKKETDSSQKSNDDDPHKDAIQFELKISYNGRTYSAMRTLPNLIQLRNDLIAEITNRRKAMRDRRRRWGKRISIDSIYPIEGEIYSVSNEDDDDDMTVNTMEDDLQDVTIPELPDYYASELTYSGRSFACKGFTFLQGLLRLYCPAIENWLLKITDLVPPMDSPSLSQFLWEPVSDEIAVVPSATLPRRVSNQSFATLVSIQEDEETGDE